MASKTARQYLQETRWGILVELSLVAGVPFPIIALGWRLVGDDAFARQAVVWFANVAMLLVIWGGLRLRGQAWSHFGLGSAFRGWGRIVRNVLRSVVVLLAALLAFMLGAIPMVNLGFDVQQADMSGYSWLQGNLLTLASALAAIYLVSSFGEEIIYRGFLITRLGELGDGNHEWIATRTAVGLSAIVFGMIHFSWGLMGVVQTTCMGLALGVAYVQLKHNLWPLVLAHAYLDTLLLVQLYVGPTQPNG